MTNNELQQVLDIVRYFLIEIRSLPDEGLKDSKLIAKSLHNVPTMLKNWENMEFSELIEDLRLRVSHHSQIHYLRNYLPEIR